MNANLIQIKDKVIPVLKSAGATRSAIFGSTVRDEARADSDVDLLVELPREMSLLDFVSLKMKLEDVLGKKVDLVEYSAIKPRIKDQILSEQVQIL